MNDDNDKYFEDLESFDPLGDLRKFLKSIPTGEEIKTPERKDIIIDDINSQQTSPQRKIIVISSPSGGGKSTIVEKLLHFSGNKFNLYYGISTTTRSPRPEEIKGINYEFVSKEMFLNAVRSGFFIEWDESSPGNYYGTSKKLLNRILRTHNYISELNTNGAKAMKAMYGDDCLTIFLAPPSFDILRERLEKRGTETKEEIKGRLDLAVKELDDIDFFDHVIVNSDLEDTFNEVVNILENFII